MAAAARQGIQWPLCTPADRRYICKRRRQGTAPMLRTPLVASHPAWRACLPDTQDALKTSGPQMFKLQQLQAAIPAPRPWWAGCRRGGQGLKAQSQAHVGQDELTPYGRNNTLPSCRLRRCIGQPPHNEMQTMRVWHAPSECRTSCKWSPAVTCDHASLCVRHESPTTRKPSRKHGHNHSSTARRAGNGGGGACSRLWLRPARSIPHPLRCRGRPDNARAGTAMERLARPPTRTHTNPFPAHSPAPV